MSGLNRELFHECRLEAISESTAASDFWAGAKLGFPVVVASAPFALAVRRACRRQRLYRRRSDADERDRLRRRQPDGRHRAVRPERRALADRAVDLRRQFPPCALFRRDRPPHRRIGRCAAGASASSCSPIRNLPKPNARPRPARRSASPGISGMGAGRSMCPGSSKRDSAPFRRPHSGHACARPRFPAADLFPRPGHGLPQAAAVAAGRARERRRLDRRLQDRSARPGMFRSARWPACCSPRPCRSPHKWTARRTSHEHDASGSSSRARC